MIRVVIFACLLSIALISCGDQPAARPGTAQATAAGAQARVDAAARAADVAGTDAARLAGEAAAATARAAATGLEDDITAAVEARVRAAQAQAVHVALLQQESTARTAASAAIKAAAAERDAEQAAQDYRSWVRLCRIVGLTAIGGGILIGGLVGWLLERPRTGVGISLLLGAAGSACIAIGPATAWLPWMVGGAAVLALAWWAIGHRLDRLRAAAELAKRELMQGAVIAGSRAIDAIERDAPHRVSAAKAALGDAIAVAGLGTTIERLRGPSRDWSTNTTPT